MKASITITQVNFSAAIVKYYVEKAVNTITPKIGEQLTEEAVQLLIDKGVKVTIIKKLNSLRRK